MADPAAAAADFEATAETIALLRRSLSVMTEQVNQLAADNRTLSDAIRDINATAYGPGHGELELQRIAFICRVPAVRNAMKGGF